MVAVDTQGAARQYKSIVCGVIEMEAISPVEEEQLIEIYRQLNPSDRELALIILERLAGSKNQSHALIRNSQHGRHNNFQINGGYNSQAGEEQ